MNIICKIFSHKITRVNTKRMFAWCGRCDKGLKVSYDMLSGKTRVIGDYGIQKTFCWCDCGNELCSTDSYDYYRNLGDSNTIIYYKCTKCNECSEWDFGAPVPIRLYPRDYWCICGCEIAYIKEFKSFCADCNKRCK